MQATRLVELVWEIRKLPSKQADHSRPWRRTRTERLARLQFLNASYEQIINPTRRFLRCEGTSSKKVF